MYKDFKKSESLDTGFVGGNGIIWMFSGIILGLLVGLGMYFFANNKSPVLSSVDNVQKKIASAQSTSTEITPKVVTRKVIESVNNSKQRIGEENQRHKNFSYYAVLPNLDVPVGAAARPIKTSVKELKNDDSTIQKSVLLDGQDILSSDSVDVSQSGGYLLQVASFRREDKANQTINKLSQKGVKAYVQEKQVNGRIWFRVVAGPLDQSGVDSWKAQAEKMGHRPMVISLRQ